MFGLLHVRSPNASVFCVCQQQPCQAPLFDAAAVDILVVSKVCASPMNALHVVPSIIGVLHEQQ